jgi:lysine 6-dehydrogenase
MKDGYSVIILGAGRQGTAAAYDFLHRGGAAHVTLADGSIATARRAAATLRKLIIPRSAAVVAAGFDARRNSALQSLLRGHHLVLSALPYYLNPAVARAAVAAGIHYLDLGGHFPTTQRIQSLSARAKRAGVAVIPDCGVAPGLCNHLAALGLRRMDRPRDVAIYCGGLPQHPRPPLGYKLVFNLEGVLGNYFGDAWTLQDGAIAKAEPLSGREELSFGPPLNRLEAAVTGGATAAAPWSWKGLLRSYTYKTLRYPGHFDTILALRDLGLLESAPLTVRGKSVVPREVFIRAAEPRLRFPDDRDLLILRVVVRGTDGGHPVEIVYDVLDTYDPDTGFTAMQRTTGFSAGAVGALVVTGVVTRRGVLAAERDVPPEAFYAEILRRGIKVREIRRCPDAAGSLSTGPHRLISL